MRESKSLL